MFRFSTLLSIFSFFYSSTSLKTDDSLDFRYVAKDYVHTLFSFTIEEEITKNNYGYFPRQIANIVNKYEIDSFGVSVSRGHWRWAIDATSEVNSKRYILPAGGLLEAVKTGKFSENNEKFDQKTWSDFTYELAGVTCSSFNRIDEKVTGWTANGTRAFGQLPAEAVCTENLTPWLRLLKTSRKQDGLVQLIKDNVYKFQESHYFGLTIDSEISEGENSGFVIKMTQTLSAVWKIPGNNVKLGDIFKVKGLQFPDSQKIPKYPQNLPYQLLPQPNNDPFNQDISIKRYLTSNGRGQLGGVINTEITHSCDSELEVLEIHVVDVLQWCIAPFLSSFKKDGSGEILSMKWIGGKIRESPYQIEYTAKIKRCDKLSTSFEFESKLLGWTNYPADAERGIFINPAIVTLVNHASSTVGTEQEKEEEEAVPTTVTTTETTGNGPNKAFKNSLVLYSTGLIIDVPKPDFSMPFNALCLACTAVAILFGNIHSVCTRSVEIASDLNEKFTVKIGKKMKNKFLAIFKKQSVETTENTEKEDTKITENTTFTEKIETTENTAISENLDTDNKKSE